MHDDASAHAQSWLTLCDPMNWTSPSFTISCSLIKFIFIESVMLSNHLILGVTPFLCLQSFPASGSFPMNQFFPSGCQSIGTSVSASVLPMNIQDWFPLGGTGLVSLSSRDSQESSPTPQFESINSLALSLLYSPTLTSIHDFCKNHRFDDMGFVSKVMSLIFFKTLPSFIIAVFLRSKDLSVLWLQSLLQWL